MADSLSKKIIAVLRTRLQTILVSGGFRTDAGSVVRHGGLKTDSPDLHLALYASSGQEREDKGRNRVDVLLQITVRGWVPVPDSDDAGDLTEDVIADVQQALEQNTKRALGDDGNGALARDLTPLGRLTMVPLRGPAHDYSRNDEFTLTYQVGYVRKYGSPDERA